MKVSNILIIFLNDLKTKYNINAIVEMLNYLLVTVLIQQVLWFQGIKSMSFSRVVEWNFFMCWFFGIIISTCALNSFSISLGA